MRLLTLLAVPVALFAGQVRFARLGEFQGQVEVQLHAADPWIRAERNLPLGEAARVRTGPDARVEIELDEGSALRLGPDSLAEISDYAMLSTGQRITLLSLDSGIAYFTGEPRAKDSLSIALPGGHMVFTRGTRARIEVDSTGAEISVIEGSLTFSSPRTETRLDEGRALLINPALPSGVAFRSEIVSKNLDAWSEERDRTLQAPASAAHVRPTFGAADLDGYGEWVQAVGLGYVWKPKVPSNWLPYRLGRWRWYDSMGYAWVSDEHWGWLPYHYGRWAKRDGLGWVWTPGKSEIFKPGEVYWLRGATLAGWGPLAPGENWLAASTPSQFQNANTTYAAFAQDLRVIDPAGFAGQPKDPLSAAVFVAALPSPSFPASRLDTSRPALRSGARVTPYISGVSFEDAGSQSTYSDYAEPAMPAEQMSDAAADEPYPQPVYPGIIVVNPPGNPDYSRRRRPPAEQGRGPEQPPAPPVTPVPQPPEPSPAQPAAPRNPFATGVQARPPAGSPPPASGRPPASPGAIPTPPRVGSRPEASRTPEPAPAPAPAPIPTPPAPVSRMRPEPDRSRPVTESQPVAPPPAPAPTPAPPPAPTPAPPPAPTPAPPPAPTPAPPPAPTPAPPPAPTPAPPPAPAPAPAPPPAAAPAPAPAPAPEHDRPSRPDSQPQRPRGL